jgi:hypothetical protein
MKKLVTTLAVAGVAAGAFAQGSVTQIQNMFSSDGITAQGANAADPASATTWFSGTVTIALYYAASASVSAGQASTINTLDATAGAAALAQALTDGFVLDSATTTAGSTAGGVTGYTVTTGGITAGPNTIGLLAPAPTSGNGWLGMLVTEVGGANDGAQGFIVWSQGNLGGNPTTTPAGIPATIAVDPAGLNIVLTPVPEPATMALAALGGASLLLFRRKK